MIAPPKPSPLVADTPQDPEALIEEARRRARMRRRRRGGAGLIASVVGIAAFFGLGGGGGPHHLNRPLTPVAQATTMPSYHHNGDLVVADYAGLLAINPTSGTTHRLLTYCPGSLEAGCSAAFSWSPDGTQLVYSVVDGFDGRFSNQDGIWIFARGTGQRRRLARCDQATCPTSLAWSPDGSLIAAAVGRRLETMRPTGGAESAVATFPGDVTAVSWSPNGRRLAVVALAESTGGRQNLYVVGASGAVQARLGSAPVPYWGQAPASRRPALASPTWAPDGRSIAYVRVGPCSPRCLGDYGGGFPGPRVEVIDAAVGGAGGRHVLVASRHLGKPPFGGCACHAWWPPSLVWSPDGTRLAMVSPAGVFLMSETGKRFRRLASSNGGAIAWEPVAR